MGNEKIKLSDYYLGDYYNFISTDNEVVVADRMGFLLSLDTAQTLKSILEKYIETHSQKEISRYNFDLFRKHNNPDAEPVRKEYKPTSGYVYFLSDNNGYIKIGKTINIEARIEGMLLPEEPKLLHSIRVKDYNKAEIIFHEFYADCRKRGEWFALGPKQRADIQNGYYPDGIDELLVEVNDELE